MKGRSGRPGLPVPNSPYGLCGREVTLKWNASGKYGQSSVMTRLSIAQLQAELEGDCTPTAGSGARGDGGKGDWGGGVGGVGGGGSEDAN